MCIDALYTSVVYNRTKHVIDSNDLYSETITFLVNVIHAHAITSEKERNYKFGYYCEHTYTFLIYIYIEDITIKYKIYFGTRLTATFYRHILKNYIFVHFHSVVHLIEVLR